MNKNEALQAYRGTILSDGCLGLDSQNARFFLNLSDSKDNLVQREKIPAEKLLEFLQCFVVEVLEPLGVKPCSGQPRMAKFRYGGLGADEWVLGVTVRTLTSELSTELYYEYYPNNVKTIPEDFDLTDILLAWFFMFDGNSKWNNNGGPGVQVELSTSGFDLRSVELFENQLHKLGVSTGRGHYRSAGKGAGIAIMIPQNRVDYFMDLIDPYVISPYRYKIKYRGSCPLGLAEKYREGHNEYMREYRRKKGEERIILSDLELSGSLAKIQSVRSAIKRGKLDAE